MTYISDSYQYTLPDLTSLLKIFGEKKQFLDNIHWVAYNRLLQYLYDTYLTNINKVVVFDRDWYYHSVVFANLDLHIHFDIEYVHKIETLQIFSDRIVSGSFFTSSVDNSYASAFYHTVSKEDLSFNYENCNEPVSLILFPCSTEIPYLVIDGNHRITAHKQKNKTINIHIIDALKYSNIFYTEFDYAIYLLMNYLQTAMFESNSQYRSKVLI